MTVGQVVWVTGEAVLVPVDQEGVVVLGEFPEKTLAHLFKIPER